MAKISTARTTRPDPAQESLVQRKDKLNERVKELISLLIETKRSWNGKPAPLIGVNEPHSIKDPLPEETGRAMDDIVNMVQTVDSELEQIINQQDQYSKTRRKPQPKKAPQPQTTQPAYTEQTQQATEPDNTLDLSSIASSSVSRFLSHVRAPFQFGDANKWGRLRLLRAAANVKKNLESIQDLVLSKSDNAIPHAIYSSKNLFYMFDNELVEPILNSMRELPKTIKQEQTTEETEESNSNTSESDYDFNPREQEEYQYTDIEYGLKSMRLELEALRRRLTPDSFKPFGESYHTLLRRIQYVSSLLKHNYNEAHNEYKQLISDIQSFTDTINEVSVDFQKEANRFTRFLKRKNVEYLTPSSSTQRSLRLRIDNEIKQSLISLNKLMDAMEKPNINLASLSGYLKDTAISMRNIYIPLATLGEIYNSNAKMTRYKENVSKKNKSTGLVNIPNTDLSTMNKLIDGFNNIVLKINTVKAEHG